MRSLFLHKNDYKKHKNNKGITLIALIITIIILLILAGISVATLTGENGIINEATTAKRESEVKSWEERIDTAILEAEKNHLNPTIDDVIEELKKAGVIENSDDVNKETGIIKTEEPSYEIGGKLDDYLGIEVGDKEESEGGENNQNGEGTNKEKPKVGDYVDYNPTILDKNGTKVDSSKLTYVSPTGTGMSHGNGYKSQENDGGQTFTAIEDIRWRIFSIEDDGRVILISENPLTKDQINENEGEFMMYGAVGYLYAERELNEICKIYGYGYGADTSQVTEYKYGGPLDLDENSQELVGQIIGSGARSLNKEDINKKAEITEEDKKDMYNSYGDTDSPTNNIYFPTITTQDGASGLAGVKNLKCTYHFSYNLDRIKDPVIQELLSIYNEPYYLASRSLATSNGCAFGVGYVLNGRVSEFTVAFGITNVLQSYEEDAKIRPVVTLKANAIDTNTDYVAEGHWNLK